MASGQSLGSLRFKSVVSQNIAGGLSCHIMISDPLVSQFRSAALYRLIGHGGAGSAVTVDGVTDSSPVVIE